MQKPRDPRELAIDLLARSTCTVQVAAVLADSSGIFSWGHNHVGFDGMGQHAEAEAIRRANRKRLRGATIYVAAVRKRNQKIVSACPCEDCYLRIAAAGVKKIYYRGASGEWCETSLC